MQREIGLFKTWGARPAERRATAAVTVVVVLAVHALTLRISPTIWQDEVQIVDLGRQALQPQDQTWSLSWIADGRPIRFINYLGPVLQEATYRMTAPSPVGPRVSTLLGAMLAAAFAYAWLRARGIPFRSAWLWTLVLLLDPQFVASYRGARVDSWVLALSFAACLAARRGADAEGPSSSASRWAPIAYFGGAGLLAGIGFFVWPSAFYLYPLLLADLVEGSNRAPRVFARRLALVIGGGLLAGIVCLVPLRAELDTVWRDLFVSKDAYLSQGSLPKRLLTGLAALPMAFKLSPILPLLAAAALVFRRNIAVTVAAAATVAIMLPTQVYAGRVVYLLPYMIVLAAQGGEELRTTRPQRPWSTIRLAMFGIALVWAVGLSLVARPVNAWAGRKARDPELISATVDHLVEQPHPRVYLGAWEFYYAGRAAGWEMFVPYGKFSPVQSASFYQSLDAAIVNSKDPMSPTDLLRAAGLEPSREVEVGGAGAFNAASLRGRGFGTYVLYTRRGRP